MPQLWNGRRNWTTASTWPGSGQIPEAETRCPKNFTSSWPMAANMKFQSNRWVLLEVEEKERGIVRFPQLAIGWPPAARRDNMSWI